MTTSETIAAINEACETLQQEFADLAVKAVRASDDMDSAVGRLKQWKCLYTYPGSGIPAKEGYQDNKPSWFDHWILGIIPLEQVAHPKADEARAKVAEMFGKITVNDENYELNADDLAETPMKLGQFITAWEEIAGTVSSKVAAAIPSDPAYVSTSGSTTGWLSPTASSAYSATFSSQNQAADSTESLISDMDLNCANLLGSMTTSVQDMAGITDAQDKMYADWMLGAAKIPTDFNGFVDYVGNAVTLIQGIQDDETSKRTALGQMLNDSIVGVLNISGLDRDINMMGESEADAGWPSPANISVGVAESGEPTRSVLEFNTQYFVDHARFWDSISTELGTLNTSSQGVPDLPIMFARLPAFSASQSYALNQLSDRITTDVLGKGKQATADTETKLRDTIREYLRAEAENEAIANEIYNTISG